MKQRRRSNPAAKPPPNQQRRTRPTFSEVVSTASHRARETANRPGDRGRKFVWAAMAAADADDAPDDAGHIRLLLGRLAGTILLPLCWVTTWTLLSRFSQATMDGGFWRSAEFWYFAVGSLVMLGWFWCGLLRVPFLIMYVFGHELTHAIFVLLHLGKVSRIWVSREGGYILTNKSNLLIALSPYFVPFWSAVAAAIYWLGRWYAGGSVGWDRAFYAAIGVTWTFHMVWTIWMIPRDQPDLRDSGTCLSLTVIWMANLLVLIGLLCVASDSQGAYLRDFWMEWVRHAAVWSDTIYHLVDHLVKDFRAAARF